MSIPHRVFCWSGRVGWCSRNMDISTPTSVHVKHSMNQLMNFRTKTKQNKHTFFLLFLVYEILLVGSSSCCLHSRNAPVHQGNFTVWFRIAFYLKTISASCMDFLYFTYLSQPPKIKFQCSLQCLSKWEFNTIRSSGWWLTTKDNNLNTLSVCYKHCPICWDPLSLDFSIILSDLKE